jgi:ArsR family transcriptional regulator, arsenate/arsenite/antimonite-responsive transcriptional repressor
MEASQAIAIMSALAQPTRYRCYAHLVQRLECTSGELAEAVEVPANLMSSHLAILSHAGLVSSRRSGRSIVYSVDRKTLLELVGHLVSMASSAQTEPS